MDELDKMFPIGDGHGWCIEAKTGEPAYFRSCGYVEGELPYQYLSESVGGYIERVPLPPAFHNLMDIWANEEGLLKPNPTVNFMITRLVQDAWAKQGEVIKEWGPVSKDEMEPIDLSGAYPVIVGDCLITGPDSKGLGKQALEFMWMRYGQ